MNYPENANAKWTAAVWGWNGRWLRGFAGWGWMPARRIQTRNPRLLLELNTECWMLNVERWTLNTGAGAACNCLCLLKRCAPLCPFQCCTFRSDGALARVLCLRLGQLWVFDFSGSGCGPCLDEFEFEACDSSPILRGEGSAAHLIIFDTDKLHCRYVHRI